MAKGQQHTRAYSNSNKTQFALPSLFSSSYPLDHGGYQNGILDRPDTLTEQLKAAGYETALFSNMIRVRKVYGYARGADHLFNFVDAFVTLAQFYTQDVQASDNRYRLRPRKIEDIKSDLLESVPELLDGLSKELHERINYPDYMHSNIMPHSKEYLQYQFDVIEGLRNSFQSAPDRFVNGLCKASDPYTALWPRHPDLIPLPMNASSHHLAACLCNWLKHRSRLDRPFFAYVQFLEAHDRLTTTMDRELSARERAEEVDHNDDLRREIMQQKGAYNGSTNYDQSLRLVDGKIRIILDKIEEMGLTGETLFVVTADHGFMNGVAQRRHVDLTDMLEETIHVPLAFVHPDIEPRVEEGLCCHLDVAPSILGFLGLASPPGFQGNDLVSSPSPSRKFILSENNGRGVCDLVGKNIYLALRGERWKIQYCDKPVGPGPVSRGMIMAIHDLTVDPGELIKWDRSKKIPEEVNDLIPIAVNRCRKLRMENSPLGADSGTA